jgi:hypothetical protein
MSPGRMMYSRFTFSASRCVSSRRLLCSNRSAYWRFTVNVSVGLPDTTFFDESSLALALESESLELEEEDDPDPDPESDADSSLNIGLAAAIAKRD